MPTLPIGTWAIWFVHFARCNEEQRRIQTAARIREAGRKTDLSVELNDTRGRAKKNLSGVSAKKKEKKLPLLSSRRSWQIWLKERRWLNKRNGKRNDCLRNLRRFLFFQEEMDLRGIKTRVAGSIAFRGRFRSWLQDEYRCSNRAPPQGWMDRSCNGENCSTCAKCPRCRIGLCVGRRWEKDFEGCSKCINCTKCVASGNDEDSEIFQTPAQTSENIHRALEVEGIKELPAAELAEGFPRKQCPWCGLTQQGSTSVHRIFCMKMPIRMWLARQRATSRSYKENGSEKPCSHCGSVYSEAHAKARHEKQCGERFAALGLEKQRNFHSHNLDRHGSK